MQPEAFYLDETNLVGDVQSINIGGELDVGFLVAIGAIHDVKQNVVLANGIFSLSRLQVEAFFLLLNTL